MFGRKCRRIYKLKSLCLQKYCTERHKAAQRFTEKLLIFLLLIFFSSYSSAQNEYEKWGKAEYSYQIKTEEKVREMKLENDNPGKKIFTGIAKAYWFYISDVDGDNCPFHPTCSSFYLEAVEETNFAQGTLMFFDRFTRDMNFYKREDRYPRMRSGRFYDPVKFYTTKFNEEDYLPPVTIK